MIVYPNAKINIGLNIVARRTDGFHDISTLFYPIKEFKDILEIVINNNQSESITLTQTGIAVDCHPEDNLCVTAYRLINRVYSLPPMAMHLHKMIPSGAGLGGGSADGAFALKTINTLVGNPLNDEQLGQIALTLGSDCPFFILNTPCIGRGRGEQLQPYGINLHGYHILLVNPGIHVNTGSAYAQSQPAPWPTNLETLLSHDIQTWKNTVNNDFERTVFALHPEIERIKVELYRMGAVYAAMSGSGSTVFGIFKDSPSQNPTFSDYFTKQLPL